jgi:NAD(P)-dependent dehydrogenase (short-subunit alcohol dehydrogenase family)
MNDTFAVALNGVVAAVTGASRGAGRAIAVVLGEAGTTVYVTLRAIFFPLRQTGKPGNRIREAPPTAGLRTPSDGKSAANRSSSGRGDVLLTLTIG